MRVKNNWKRPIRIGRQVLDKGQVADVPEHLLLQPRLQKLRKTEKLIFPFHENQAEAAKRAPKPEPVELNKGVAPSPPHGEDDLTQLTNIGAGRKKVLNENGIFSFVQVLEHEDDLHEILEIPESQAAEVIKAAKSKVG